jgi:CBS domain-containing protein
MQAHDVMTAEVVTVNADTPLPQIACVLLEHGISAVPVLDADGVPIGMVSDCDLATHSASDRSGRRDWWLGLLADGSSLDDNVLQLLRSPDRTAGNVMATPVITVGEATDLVELVRLLARNHIKRVRVLKDGHIKGIISRVDDAARLATERQRQETAEILINTHVSDEAWQQMLRHAREAAGKGGDRVAGAALSQPAL